MQQHLAGLCSSILLAMAFAMVSPAQAANSGQLLWQIGQKDSNFAELALTGIEGNASYPTRFPQDVTFTVGKDDPSQAWSYIQPGSADGWAGAGEHPFTILFNLDANKYEGYALNLHLTSAHSASPPKISVQINDRIGYIQTTAGPGDHVLSDPNAGGQQSHTIYLPGEVLKAGENRIIIKAEGSWILYDGLELVGLSQLGNVTPLKAANFIQSLWQIGEKDSNFAEFALVGTEGYASYPIRFPQDVSFTVGKDDPSQDWSYIHPGSGDGWAGSREHPFTVMFNLDENKHEAYALNLHLTSAHGGSPPKIKVQINDETRYIQATAGPWGDLALSDPKTGGQQSHSIFFQDEVLKVGENRITLTTEGAWMLYDGLELLGHSLIDDVTAVEATVQQGYYRRPDGNSSLIDLKFVGGMLQEPAEIKIHCQGRTTTRFIDPGNKLLQSAQVYVPVDLSEQEALQAEIVMEYGSIELATTVEIPPLRKWEIHLVHQTHLDIGYTHTQEDVLRLQVDHFHKALDYIDANSDYPEEARFKWHPEGMWAVEEFMRTESDEAKERFIAATRSRDNHIDALYAQAMTGAYSEEELFELIGAAARYGREYGVTVDSAMQTDVPGYTWGLVNALAHHGIKYMSASPNYGHRVGHTFKHADQPAYWESPCGNNRILLWLSGRPYSWSIGSTMTETFDKSQIDHYLYELDLQGYPYDMVMIRYGMGGDNGPPNPALPRFVKEWNEKYVWPKLIVSRNSDLMAEMEKRYGDELPVIRGDFTPYWEDGMASTAADVGISRRAAEQLVQAQSLWTMLDADAYPHAAFEKAWNNLIMYNEHTWGAINSITAPDSDFAVQQADFKQKYALDGAKMADDLLDGGVQTYVKESSNFVDVYNTLNWTRSQVVTLSSEQSKAGDRVEDGTGRAVASQRLASGELAFLAENIPAFGAKRYIVKKGKAVSNGAAVKVMAHSLSNGSVTVLIDPKTGAIQSLKQKEIDAEIVDLSKGYGVNDYLYILGRDAAENNMRIDSPVEISIVDAGPLVGTLKIESDAPGANKLTRTLRVVHDSDVVEMVNLVDKLKERRAEGVYFNFPFNVPNGIMKIDTPWSVFQPEKDQLRGANRNFFCVQRFVNISNEDYGVTWMSIDAPLVQWDPIRIAGPLVQSDFRTTITPNQTIHSWVMNNHWETNYKADQEGLIPFRYAIWPHAGGYDAEKSQQYSRAVHQPLIAVSADPRKPVVQPKLEVDGQGIVVTSLKPSRDGDGYMVRLFNTSETSSTASLNWEKDGYAIWLSNPLEDKLKKINGKVSMDSQEIVTLRITK